MYSFWKLITDKMPNILACNITVDKPTHDCYYTVVFPLTTWCISFLHKLGKAVPTVSTEVSWIMQPSGTCFESIISWSLFRPQLGNDVPTASTGVTWLTQPSPFCWNINLSLLFYQLYLTSPAVGITAKIPTPWEYYIPCNSSLTKQLILAFQEFYQ